MLADAEADYVRRIPEGRVQSGDVVRHERALIVVVERRDFGDDAGVVKGKHGSGVERPARRFDT
jgi:hypothetical protein